MSTVERSAAEAAGDAGSVELSIPVQSDLVVLARLTAATVAGRAGFGVEDIEDLRLAVEELCLSLVQDDQDGRLHLTFECEPDAIAVDCWYEASVGGRRARRGDAGNLSIRILDALVDEHGHETRTGGPSAWLRKRHLAPS